MPKRILIVDDDQDLTRLFRLILRRLNAEIEIVSSGERALQSIRVCRPSLILLDLMLPDIDGAEVCRRLRAEPATQDLPVIIVSARPNAPEVAQAVGATDCLLKPFLPQELVQLVQSVLHNCAADDGAQDGHAALGPQSLTMPGTGLVQSGLGMGKATLSGVGLSS